MKKNALWFCALLTLVCFGLFAQPVEITKGLRKINCQIVPMTPISKCHQGNFSTKQLAGSQRTKSLNWSGYVSLSNVKNPEIGSVTGVWGNWVVPKLHPSLNSRYCACWVGLDGFVNQTVEQVGTMEEWVNGAQQNFVWFSIYPGPLYELVGFPINPKDQFRAIVSYIGNDVFEMMIENITQGVYFVIPTSYTTSSGTQRTSAEWIVEAPSSATSILPLAHFTPVPFSECLAEIRGHSGRINSPRWAYNQILMVTHKFKDKAVPSHLSNHGKNFEVKWHHP